MQLRLQKEIVNNSVLLTLLEASSSVTFLAGAVLAARHKHAGLHEYVLAIVVGLVLAGCNARAVHMAAEVVANRTTSIPESRQAWLGPVFCLLVLLWLPVAAFLGNWIATVMLRFAI